MQALHMSMFSYISTANQFLAHAAASVLPAVIEMSRAGLKAARHGTCGFARGPFVRSILCAFL
jgi:hypothetical protein